MSTVSLIKDRGDGIFIVNNRVMGTAAQYVAAFPSHDYDYLVEDDGQIGQAYDPNGGAFGEAIPLLDDARTIKIAEVAESAKAKIQAVEVDVAGPDFIVDDYEYAKEVNEATFMELQIKSTVGDGLTTEELNEGRNIYKMNNYQRTCSKRVAQARATINGMADAAAIMALDAETDVPWPAYPTWV